MILFQKEITTDLNSTPVRIVVEENDYRRPDLIEQNIGQPEIKTNVRIEAFINGQWTNVQANILELLTIE